MLIQYSDKLDDVRFKVAKELQSAVNDTGHPFRFLVLSTVSGQQPVSRYVVLRQATETLDCYVYTDARSGKVEDLRANPRASLLFYNPLLRAQVRLMGSVEIHHQDKLAEVAWANINDHRPYAAILTPGKVIDQPEQAYEWSKGIDNKHFVVLKLKCQMMEVLQLNGCEHIRASFNRDGDSWKGNWIAP